MNECQVFLIARCSCGRIKTVYSKKFARPIVETYRGIKNPVADVAKALRFGEIKFAFLQLLGSPSELFFRPLPVLDINTRSMPLENSPIFGTQREFMVQHPAIFAISPPHSCGFREALSR